MAYQWLEVIDKLIVEKGEKRKDYFYATITSEELIQSLNIVNTEVNHLNVKTSIQIYYPKSTIESVGVNGKKGWIFHIKVRSV